MKPKEWVQIREIDAGGSRRFRVSLMEYDGWRYLRLTRLVRDAAGNWTARSWVDFPFSIIDELVGAMDRGLEISTGVWTDTRARQFIDDLNELHRRRAPKEPAA